MFGNRTPFSPLEQYFTEKVRVEFQGRGRYQVLPTDTGVDGVVRGDILSRIGHFGLILWGVDDGKGLETPLEGAVSLPSTLTNRPHSK